MSIVGYLSKIVFFKIDLFFGVVLGSQLIETKVQRCLIYTSPNHSLSHYQYPPPECYICYNWWREYLFALRHPYATTQLWLIQKDKTLITNWKCGLCSHSLSFICNMHEVLVWGRRQADKTFASQWKCFQAEIFKNTSARPRGNVLYRVHREKCPLDRKPRFLAHFYLKQL